MTVDQHNQKAPETETTYRWARERAEMLQALYIHIMVYVMVNLGLFGINYFTRGETGVWWFYWPMLLWGIGLLIHVGVTVAPFFSEEWVERKTENIAATRR